MSDLGATSSPEFFNIWVGSTAFIVGCVVFIVVKKAQSIGRKRGYGLRRDSR
jgi:hypothetical protein